MLPRRCCVPNEKVARLRHIGENGVPRAPPAQRRGDAVREPAGVYRVGRAHHGEEDQRSRRADRLYQPPHQLGHFGAARAATRILSGYPARGAPAAYPLPP
eukprot:SAG31_NODE_1600_length_7791_cov_15.201508_8_plen_101_part_00